MIIKTVGELRKLVLDNGGEIKLGALRISYGIIDGQTGDIDIHFKGMIKQWYPGGTCEEDTLLTDSAAYSVIAETPKKKEPADETRAETPKEDKETLAQGMVAAYEKILLGRDLTVGK